jgi:two-component sensor histidine kinase
VADSPLSLADIIITPRLWVGPPRASLFEAEMLAMRRLAATLAQTPAAIFEACADAALGLCRADTAGIQVLEHSDDDEGLFRWIAVAGQLKGQLQGMTAPRHFSPAGICIDTSGPLLLERPERLFDYLDVGVPFHRALLIPLTERGSGLEGAIWVMSHNDVHEFDSEDARMLQRIAVFTATGLHMARVADEARLSAAANRLAFDELDHRIKNTLQTTAALLEMHLQTIDDPQARAAIVSARDRMLTIGQLHAMGSHGMEDDLAEMVRAICHEMVGSTPACDLAVHADEIVTLPAHKAALAALIVSELVSNAIKYAFPGERHGTVTVDVRRLEEGRAELCVSDDGVPLPETVAVGHSSTHGLDLVRALAHQLGGDLDIDIPAKRFVVTFDTRMPAP